MRIAVLCDIHGNLPAFQAALDHAERQRVDRLVIAGDIVIGAPDSLACWNLAKKSGGLLLRGNHERYLAHFGTPEAPPVWETEQFSPLHWAVKQIPESDRKEIGALPLTHRIPDAPDLVFCHASMRRDNDSIFPHTPEDRLQEMFSGTMEKYILRGHNHLAQDRAWGDRTIITCGSAGLPLNGHPNAQYLLCERSRGTWRMAHQAVPYDVDAALARFSETGYIEETGVMGRLIRKELATASFHVTPFLRTYEQARKAGPVSIDQAFDQFLNI